MIADVEAGKVKRVIVKDMSRLGRDYLQVGMYTEIFFPEHDVHLSQSMMAWTATRRTMSLHLSVTSSMSGTQRTQAKNPGGEAV